MFLFDANVDQMASVLKVAIQTRVVFENKRIKKMYFCEILQSVFMLTLKTY